ncbi:MAG: PAS domain-containing protein [Deltaproteobacteria bacterium]|nr:PAS domain-containing protein [Deltaproteobacteria bacterium]
MKDYLEAEKQDRRRRRRERYLIIFLGVVISCLIFVGMRIFHLGQALPFSSSIFAFALININVILLLLLLFLTVRNLVKLLFERKKSIMGAKLRTKLVLAFVTLSLLPTIILFFVSVQFISSSIQYWFSLQLERSLKNSLEVGQDYYKDVAEGSLWFGNVLSRIIMHEGYLIPSRHEALARFADEKRKEFGLASVQVFSKDLKTVAVSRDHRIDLTAFKGPEPDVLQTAIEKGTDSYIFQSFPHGDLVSGIVPIFSRTKSKAVVGLAVTSEFIPGAFVNRLQAISKGVQEYRQLKMLRTPILASHMITLSIVTLLIIFSSIWFGFYLSKEITVPIKELAEGTHRIASGDYDFFIDLETKDEMGMLVNSFNKMTMDLKISKDRLEAANKELLASNLELEQRRLYMEIVLANVAAGVISVDARGKILTINKSAERMLDIRAAEIIGKGYKEVLAEEYCKIVDDFLRDEGLLRKGSIEKQIRLAAGNRRLTVLISLNVLRDDRGRYLGLVAVFEDLSEIEKAQRMAAWREVARRIAHEVKNPLTPIQLSAQRLKKRYGEILENGEKGIFNECTSMIITQVEELKRLVNEFSNFARLPAANPVPSNIARIIREAISLYREAHKDVRFVFNDPGNVPVFNLDREQIKRVLINLFDNAIEALDGNGEVTVDLHYDSVLKMVRIEVIDNGRGIGPENKSRLFEPYFSTKRQGTGLGLAIVNTIITDHNGFIRVKDNKPKGTRFIIELPARV